MSEFWVSQTRHWCKYCKKYISNNKPSISLHENGRAHKEEVERFLRNVYKKGREDKEAAEETRLELERIEREAHKAAGIAYKSTTTLSKPTTTTSSYSQVHIPTIEELRKQSEEEKALEAIEGRDEWAVKKEIAQVGEWEIVSQPKTVEPAFKTETTEKQTKKETVPEIFEEEEDEEDLSQFKLTEKELVVDSTEDATTVVAFKKRKLGDSNQARKKKPLRKKE